MKIKDEPLNKLLIKFTIFNRTSETPKGKQIVIEKYTRKIMKKLYNENVDVFFCDFSNTFFENLKAIYRPKETPPVNAKDSKVWLKNNEQSITYNTNYFKEDEVPMESLIIIVHEVTHFEFKMTAIKNGDYWEVSHIDEMEEKENENCKKCKEFFKPFYDEVDIDMGQ